jgi:hypothetical protein
MGSLGFLQADAEQPLPALPPYAFRRIPAGKAVPVQKFIRHDALRKAPSAAVSGGISIAAKTKGRQIALPPSLVLE